MSIYIQQDDALDKMAEVEGNEWKRLQEHDPDPNCSFRAFSEAWTNDFSGRTDQMSKGAALNYCIKVNGNGAIYGHSGYNRYAVRADGMLLFLRDLAINAESLEKAKAVGFDIW